MRVGQVLFRILVFMTLLQSDVAEAVLQAERSSPVYVVQEGRNEIALVERFSMFIEHSARIRRVMDFDEEVLTVQTVGDNPQQVRIYALQSGVTSLTIVDENDRTFELEILIRGDVRHLESFIRRLYPDNTIHVEEISDESVRLDGWVTKPEHVSEIQAIAEQFYPEVLNHMQAGGVQQIMLKCTVMEVQRSKLRRLGKNFSMVRPDGYLVSTPGPITPISGLEVAGGAASITQRGFSDSTITWGLTRPNSVFQGFVQAMLDEGIFKTHATPMIVTDNGRPANFLSGGETPIPVAGGLGTSGVQYREFGIQLNAVPYILGNGRVRLEVETRVSDQDFSQVVIINGAPTTSFRTNSANTQVEMNFGEALVIAGLVSRRSYGTTQKVPFLGELPWLGAAFSKKQHTESETELIILVTPELVAPMTPEQVPAIGPGMSTDIPVDRELFAYGMLEVPKVGDECEQCRTQPAAAKRCSDPNCRNCREIDCTDAGKSGKRAPTSSRTAGQERPTPEPADAGGGGRIKPASRSKIRETDKSETDSGAKLRIPDDEGLISPTMR